MNLTAKIENDLIRFMVKPKKNKDTIEALIYEVKSLDSNKGPYHGRYVCTLHYRTET